MSGLRPIIDAVESAFPGTTATIDRFSGVSSKVGCRLSIPGMGHSILVKHYIGCGSYWTTTMAPTAEESRSGDEHDIDIEGCIRRVLELASTGGSTARDTFRGMPSQRVLEKLQHEERQR